MQNDSFQNPDNFHDDSRVLRYLLHNVKGIMPVSGGVMGDALETEYASAEQEFQFEPGVSAEF